MLNTNQAARIKSLAEVSRESRTKYSTTEPLRSFQKQQGGGGAGGLDPLNNHKAIGFLNILWKTTKLPSQHLILGHYRAASETPFKFKWRFAGGPIIANFQ